MTPPYRVWFPAVEAAQLLGISRSLLYDLVRQGKQANPPADAIPPTKTRTFGTRLCIHRSVIFGVEPILTALPQPAITDAQLDAAIERVLFKIIGNVYADSLHRRAG